MSGQKLRRREVTLGLRGRSAAEVVSAGGRVGVTLRRDGGTAQVRVSDTGCGIGVESRAHADGQRAVVLDVAERQVPQLSSVAIPADERSGRR